MLSVLLRMHGSGFLHDINKITLDDNIFTLRNFVIKKQTEECPVKSEGHKNTTAPCSELTKIKLKERLQGKDADVMMMVTSPFCRNHKDKTKQQKIVGTFLKHLINIKHVLNSNQGAMWAVLVTMDGSSVLHMLRMILGKTNCRHYRYINQSNALGIWTYFSEWRMLG